MHRPCLSLTQASTWQMNYRSTFCALILPRHLHWLGAIFHGQRIVPFLSYHNHLGLSAWCAPCLIPLPSPPALSQSPAELALRHHPSFQQRALLGQDQLSSGSALYLPYLLCSSQTLWGAGAALVSGHHAPHPTDCCSMRIKEMTWITQGDIATIDPHR